jgi:hypothetical protein
MKRFFIIIWILVIFFTIYGALPVRIPDKNVVFGADKVLVQHHEYTGSPDFTIIKGVLSIPDSLKPILTDSSNDITVLGNTPVNYTSDDNLDFLMNDFILEGKVTGIDSISDGEGYRPVFKVTEWGMIKYYARFWTFNIVFFILYFTLLPVIFIVTLVVIAIYLIKKKDKKV